MFNLGYTPEVAEIGRAGLPPAILKHAGACFTHRYPYVAKLSGGVATDHPRERVRQKAGVGS